MRYYYAARIETDGGATEIDGAQVVLAEDYDRLREALKEIAYGFGRLAYSEDAAKMVEIARTALQEDRETKMPPYKGEREAALRELQEDRDES